MFLSLSHFPLSETNNQTGFGIKVLEMATATCRPPPPYYKLYKDYLQDLKSAPQSPPPIEGTYVCYGANYTTDDVLPSWKNRECVNCAQKAQILTVIVNGILRGRVLLHQLQIILVLHLQQLSLPLQVPPPWHRHSPGPTVTSASPTPTTLFLARRNRWSW